MPELGILGNQIIVDLDSSGNLKWAGNRPKRICWGVGADDRWHFSEERASIRQSIDSNEVTPITRMKVPGGDITQRVEIIPWEGGSVTKIEFCNETPIPVAISILLFNFGQIDINATTVYQEKKPVIRASKPVSISAFAEGYENLTNEIQKTEISDSSSANNAGDIALLFPLPHSTKLELLINNQSSDSLPAIEEVPRFEEIANGWQKHFDNGMGIQADDNRLATVLNSSLRHLLIGSDQEIGSKFWNDDTTEHTTHLAILALLSWGHSESAKKLIYKTMESAPTNLFANSVSQETLYTICLWGKYLEFSPVHDSLISISPWLQDSIRSLLASLPGKRRLQKKSMTLEIASLQAAIKIFIFVGQERLATELQSQVQKIQELKSQKDYSEPFEKFTTSYQHAIGNLADYLKIENTSVTLDQVLAKTDATGSFITGLRQQDPTFSALFLLAIRAGFVQEKKILTGERQIQVASSYNPDWIGIGMQVKDAPISTGTLGYAIRWHGTSPALLWEAKTSKKVIINAETIDKNWSSTEHVGETLLAKQLAPETAVTIHSDTSLLRETVNLESPEGGTFQ